MTQALLQETKSEGWQSILANAVTDIQELLNLLEIPVETIASSFVNRQFPLRVPRGFVDRMQKRNPQDPLLQQVLPTYAELEVVPGYTHDPLQERSANVTPGILHKYLGRVLVIAAGGCAINCRYCFRRHFPYGDNILGRKDWHKIIEYIANDVSITEVIFSGGDPLIATDTQLREFSKQVEKINHVQRLRMHSRLPIVIPERITDEFIDWFAGSRLKPVMVLHTNHANEIDTYVMTAIQKMRSANIIVFNQSVLLKNINDDLHTLVALSEKLFEAGVIPYYLHLMDKVQGAAHFTVSEEQAKILIQGLMEKLPGYLVPKLVFEQPGALSKTMVNLD